MVFGKIEVLDFCGPFEVFSITRLDKEQRCKEPSPFEVLLVAEKGGPITTTGGMREIPVFSFQDCSKLDILNTWKFRRIVCRLAI